MIILRNSIRNSIDSIFISNISYAIMVPFSSLGKKEKKKVILNAT